MESTINISKRFGSLAILIIMSLLSTVSLRVTARQNGFDHTRLSKIDSLIDRHIREQHIPGGAALIMKNGQIVYNAAFGYADIGTKKKLRTDDIFRLASQSKAITSLGALILWEEGKFLLDDPLSKYIPAFKNTQVLTSYDPNTGGYTTKPASREITIRDLFRHSSGIAYPALFSDPVMFNLYKRSGILTGIGNFQSTAKENMEKLAKLPLQHSPGEAWTYGLNTDLLGYFIEVISGEPLDVYLAKKVFGPLEMKDTYFHLPEPKKNRLVSLYEDLPSSHQLVKVDHPIFDSADANFPLNKTPYLSGGAGIVSTLSDLSNFYTMYLNKGTFKGKQIIGRKTVELALGNQLTPEMKISPMPPQIEHFAFTLGGFQLTTEENRHVSHRSIGSFGWGGAYNTHGWADPKEGLIGILFTQEYLSNYFSIGEEFQVAVYQAISNQ